MVYWESETLTLRKNQKFSEKKNLNMLCIIIMEKKVYTISNFKHILTSNNILWCAF